eukprot:5143416-Amphidinium_carterae.1
MLNGRWFRMHCVDLDAVVGEGSNCSGLRSCRSNRTVVLWGPLLGPGRLKGAELSPLCSNVLMST